MDLQVSEIGANVTCVRLDGRLDAPGADAIGVRFTAAVASGGPRAAVDLSRVSFLASMGIRLLIGAARALHARGGKVVLFGAQEMVRNVLDQASIDQIIPIVATEQQALDELAA